MVSTREMAKIGKKIEDIVASLEHYAPFFDSRVQREQKNVDYSCLLCDVPLKLYENAGLSYSNSAVRWAHPDCLRAVAPKLDKKHLPMAALVTDKKAQHKAAKAFYERQALLTGRPIKEKVDVAKLTEKIRAELLAEMAATPTPAVNVAEIEEKIRAEVEAEYDDLFEQAVNKINAQKEQIAALQGIVTEMTAKLETLQNPAPTTTTPTEPVQETEAPKRTMTTAEQRAQRRAARELLKKTAA